MKYINKLLALLVLLTMPVIAQADETLYTAPDGSFSVTIPAGWTETSAEQYGLFTKTDGTALYLLHVTAPTVPEGITAALKIIAPEFNYAAIPLTDAVTEAGVWKQNLYELPNNALGVSLGLQDGESVYVIYIYNPSESTLLASTADLNSILFDFVAGAPVNLADVTPAAFDETMATDLDAYITASLPSYLLPGAAVAIIQNGEVVYAKGFGVTDLESRKPVTEDTLFMIGSITKSMTTTMMASLVDEGLFTWDTLVTEIYPGFSLADANSTPLIRMRDLVNNSSGVARLDIPLALKNQTPEEVIESLQTIPVVAAPGEEFNYSNQMVAAGGYIAAMAAGAKYSVNLMDTYTHLMQERVFDPLGMTRTTFDFDKATSDSDHALPHKINPELQQVETVTLQTERFALPVAPAGAAWSSANDMAKFVQFVSEGDLTQSPEISLGDDVAYGMGWIIAEYKGQRSIGHNGETAGFSSDVTFLPDAGIGVVVLANRSGSDSFTAAVREYVFEQVFGLDHKSAAIFLATEAQYLRLYDQLIDYYPGSSLFDPIFMIDYWGNYDYNVEIALGEQSEITLKSDFVEGVILATATPGFFVGRGDLLSWTFQFGVNADGTSTITIRSLLDSSQSLTLTKQP